MNTVIVGLMVLALVPAYVMRLNEAQVKHDPLSLIVGNYAGFVCVVLAGGGPLQDDVHPWHIAAVVIALLWWACTYRLHNERSLAEIS